MASDYKHRVHSQNSFNWSHVQRGLWKNPKGHSLRETIRARKMGCKSENLLQMSRFYDLINFPTGHHSCVSPTSYNNGYRGPVLFRLHEWSVVLFRQSPKAQSNVQEEIFRHQHYGIQIHHRCSLNDRNDCRLWRWRKDGWRLVFRIIRSRGCQVWLKQWLSNFYAH